jgi:hypothetical protein
MLHLFHPRLPADLKCLKSTEPTTAAKFPCIGDYIGEKKELQKAVHQTIMVAKLEEATKRKLKHSTKLIKKGPLKGPLKRDTWGTSSTMWPL